MWVSWAGKVGEKEFEEKGSVSVPWSAEWTDVSAASRPLFFSPPPSFAPAPSSPSFAALVSAVGTKSWPASSSAGPEERSQREEVVSHHVSHHAIKQHV